MQSVFSVSGTRSVRGWFEKCELEEKVRRLVMYRERPGGNREGKDNGTCDERADREPDDRKRTHEFCLLLL